VSILKKSRFKSQKSNLKIIKIFSIYQIKAGLYPKMDEKQAEYAEGAPPPYAVQGGMPHQQQMQPQMPIQQPYAAYPTVVLAPQPGVVYTIARPHFGDHPQQVTCPNCRAQVLSQVNHTTGLITWLIAGGLFCIG
jgi:hypothetical protein